MAVQNPRVPEYWTELFLDYENLARSLKLLDLLQDTENVRKNLVALREKQVAAFPGVAEYECSLGGSLNDLATILMQRGKVAEAEKFLRDGLRANPDSYEILFELGRLYYESEHDAARARNVWELALRRWQEQLRSPR